MLIQLLSDHGSSWLIVSLNEWEFLPWSFLQLIIGFGSPEAWHLKSMSLPSDTSMSEGLSVNFGAAVISWLGLRSVIRPKKKNTHTWLQDKRNVPQSQNGYWRDMNSCPNLILVDSRMQWLKMI